jgi:glycosyltransferase involved in cell wall biosynthesis
MVHFLGRVPENILPQMYAAADVFVIPTAELECFGLIALEALACGRPVLATPVGAIPEVVGRIEPRWLAQNQSVEAISRLIIGFLGGELPSHDPERLRQIVAQTYSTENALRQLVAVATGESQ